MALSLNFKNVQHALASFWQGAASIAKTAAVDTEKVLDHAAADKAVVEGVSGAVANAVQPGSGAAVVSIEDAAFSVFAAVDAALKSGGDATTQKLLDAGLDVTAINNVKAVGTQSQAFYTLLQTVKA